MTRIVKLCNKEVGLLLRAYLDSRALKTNTEIKNICVINNKHLHFINHTKAVNKLLFWNLKNKSKLIENLFMIILFEH